MKRAAAKTRPRAGDPDSFELACHGIYDGTLHDPLRWDTLHGMAAVPEVRTALCNARQWHQSNSSVESLCGLKRDFANYGLRFRAPGGGRLNPDVAQSLRADPSIARLIEDVWGEWFLMDNVVAFWRTSPPGSDAPSCQPFLLRPEECEYSDAYGEVRLKVRRQFEKGALEHLPVERRRRYMNGFTPDPALGEGFAVLSRGPRGYGFAWPRLHRVQLALLQHQGMEAGENIAGQACRIVRLLHKIGWEPKTHAQSVDKRLQFYSAERDRSIKRVFGGKIGLLEAVTNFDHDQTLWSPLLQSDKLFDAEKWRSTAVRLHDWAGPLGRMLEATTLAPFLSGMLRTQMIAERDRLRPFIAGLIKEGYGIEAEPVWSTRCFTDPRIAADLIKQLMANGGASLQTGAEEAGLDADTERERKAAEFALYKDAATRGQVMPLLDTAHGGSPAAEGAGRPEGSPDPANDR